jgi:hypothetical protein
MSEDYENDYQNKNMNNSIDDYNNDNNHNTNTERINVNYDILYDFNDKEVFELKLGNLSFLKRKRFTENINQKDEKIKIPLEKGGLEEKPIPPANYIRWKYTKSNNDNNYNKQIILDDEDDEENENEEKEKEIKNSDKEKEKEGDFDNEKATNKYNSKDIDNYLNLVEKSNNPSNIKMISNTKIVEWSDGTMQLLIGNEYFDINKSIIDNSRYAIYDRENDLFNVKNQIKKRFIIVPSDMSSDIDSRFKSTAESSTKTKLTYSYFDKNTFNKEEFAKGRARKSAIDSLKRSNNEKDKILPNFLKRK